MESQPIYSAGPMPTEKDLRPDPVVRGYSRFLPFALIGAGVVLAIWLYMSFRNNQTPTPLAETAPTPTDRVAAGTTPFIAPTPTPGLPSNLREFNNQVFSVRYPTTFTANPNYTESTFKGVELTQVTPASSASASSQLSIKIIYLQNSAKNARQHAQDQVALEPGASSPKDIKFTGLDALQIDLKGEWGRGKVIFIQQGPDVFRLSSIIAAPLNIIPSLEATVNDIFSSFLILPASDRSK